MNKGSHVISMRKPRRRQQRTKWKETKCFRRLITEANIKSIRLSRNSSGWSVATLQSVNDQRILNDGLTVDYSCKNHWRQGDGDHSVSKLWPFLRVLWSCSCRLHRTNFSSNSDRSMHSGMEIVMVLNRESNLNDWGMWNTLSGDIGSKGEWVWEWNWIENGELHSWKVEAVK